MQIKTLHIGATIVLTIIRDNTEEFFTIYILSSLVYKTIHDNTLFNGSVLFYSFSEVLVYNVYVYSPHSSRTTEP